MGTPPGFVNSRCSVLGFSSVRPPNRGNFGSMPTVDHNEGRHCSKRNAGRRWSFPARLDEVTSPGISTDCKNSMCLGPRTMMDRTHYHHGTPTSASCRDGYADPSDSDPSAAALAVTGRFQEAITKLSQSRQTKTGTLTIAEHLDFAELSERTGRLQEARNHLAMVKKASRSSDYDRARLHLIEGMLSKQLGHLEESIRSFQQGCRLAERTDSLELLCWGQLRLLGASADLDGSELDPSLLTTLRSNTERAATPAISIAYQIFLAEYYAKRGNLGASRHHSTLAESVLATYPNIWLRGLLALHLSCLSYLEGEYLDSMTAARQALVTSKTSGHLLTGLIAQADMAATYLAVGQPARAKACLSLALQNANREEQIFGLLLETLAETQLVCGDLVGCSESLRCARDLSAEYSQSRSAWHRAWNLRTEARLLQRSGRWQESLWLIRQAGTPEASEFRSFTQAQIKGLEALALARIGRSEEAIGVIHRFVRGALSAPESHRGSLRGVSIALSAVTEGDGHGFSRCARRAAYRWSSRRDE